jgi:hypothetical protein
MRRDADVSREYSIYCTLYSIARSTMEEVVNPAGMSYSSSEVKWLRHVCFDGIQPV